MTGLEVLAISGLVMGLAGTGMSAFGQYKSGQAQESASKYNAEVAKGEAEFEEGQSRERLRSLMATQRTLYAKAGVSLTSDSPLLMMSHTAAEGEMEALNIRYRGYNQASMERWQGKQQAYAGNIGGVSTFLSGLGQSATQYAAYKGTTRKVNNA